MNKIFVKTQNVKNFIGLVENLISKPKNIPKMGLVHGEPGLGKLNPDLENRKRLYGLHVNTMEFIFVHQTL